VSNCGSWAELQQKKTSPETVRSKIKGSDFCQKITYRIGFVRDVEKKTGPDGKETEEVV
jgi:hypothetical protein